MSTEFERRRDALIAEYHREVHPMWVDYQGRMELTKSVAFRYLLKIRFRKKIRPRLNRLFSDIATAKEQTCGM